MRPDGPAAARTDHLAVLVEEDIVVHDEQPLRLMNLSSARACSVMMSPGRAGML